MKPIEEILARVSSALRTEVGLLVDNRTMPLGKTGQIYKITIKDTTGKAETPIEALVEALLALAVKECA